MSANSLMIPARNRRYQLLIHVLLLYAAIYFFVGLGVLFTIPQTSNPSASLPARIIQGLVLAPFNIIIGLLIMRRTAGNIIGLLLVLIGCGIPGASAFNGASGLVQPIIQFYNTSIQLPTLVLLLSCFPDGQIYPRRAAWWVKLVVVTASILGTVQVISTPHLELGSSSPNAFFIAALQPLDAVVRAIYPLQLFSAFIPSMIFLFLRYRHSDAIQRQQIRWFGWMASVFVLILVTWFVTLSILELQDSWFRVVLPIISNLLISGLPPLVIAIAILRYRLYDIDIIIRRTLIYSILSVILAGVFFGGVTIAQSIFRTATRQSSDLAIVASTLAIAALFTPLRRRVQNLIDRRFYRRKYDAEKMLGRFSQTLRDETNLAALQASMIGVVQETMQPTQVTLWVHTEAK